MKIWLDATPAIHGERAVRRNSRNLISSLISRNNIDYGLIYFDRRKTPAHRIFLHSEKVSQKKVSRYPMSLLVPCWKRFGEPSIERFVGDVDLLYAPDLYFPPARHGRVLSTIRGLAYLAKEELLDSNNRQKLTTAFSYARERSDYFLAVSQTTRSDLLNYTNIPKDRIFVVTHGVDPVFKRIPKPSARKMVKKRFNFKRPYLLYVGAIAIHKNVLGLMDAFSMVASHERDIDLVLAGPEETAAIAARKRVAEEHLEEKVHFLGSIDQEDSALTELYSAAEMLVFPSFYEGWCAPPLEAMACGIPVICSNIPAVVEVAGDAVIFADPKDPEAFAHAICKVLYDRNLRQQMIQSGFAHVAQHTWERSAERLENIFANIVEMI
jgi:glycosyltransferase involved in cell wall biosynthesis